MQNSINEAMPGNVRQAVKQDARPVRNSTEISIPDNITFAVLDLN